MPVGCGSWAPPRSPRSGSSTARTRRSASGRWSTSTSCPATAPTSTRRGYTGPNVWFIQYRDGVDHRRADERLRREIDPIGSDRGSLVVTPVQRPAEIVNATDIGGAPTILAGALAVASLASLGLALATSVRRRRRDLSLLKVLGFTGHQVGATVRWQAAVTVAVGVLVGVPLGIIGGRVLWVLFAGQLDVLPEPSTPLLLIAAIAAAAFAVGLLAAALPRRARPAASDRESWLPLRVMQP